MRDRIKELRRVRACELLANRKNWQRHPHRQRAALNAIVGEVGFAPAVIAYETAEGLVLIDGHGRVEGAKPDELIPTLVLDVDGSDADKLLAAMDTIAKMAEPDADALSDLLEAVTFDDADLRRMVAGRGGNVGLVDQNGFDNASKLLKRLYGRAVEFSGARFTGKRTRPKNAKPAMSIRVRRSQMNVDG